MDRTSVDQGDLNRSPGYNDVTRSTEEYSPVLRFEEGNYTLEQEIDSIVKEARNFIYGFPLRFLLLFVTFFFFYLFFRAMIYLNDVYYYDKNIDTFLDRIHELVDDRHLEFLAEFSNYLLYPYIVILVLRFLLVYPIVFNIQIWMRFWSIYIFTYLIRGLSVIFTSIPPPHPRCSLMTKGDSFWNSLSNILFEKGDTVPCTGLLFSGPAYFVILGFIVLMQNSNFLMIITMFLYAAVVIVSLVASKFYYSIDVMFSLLFSTFFYYFYFTRIDSYGVSFMNNLHNRYSNQNQPVRLTLLESTWSNKYLNKWIASIEQIPKLLLLGYKIKRLQSLIKQEKTVDEASLRKFRMLLLVFGLADCNEILTLYRGTDAFNFSYWRKIKLRLSLRQDKVSLLKK